MTQLSATGRKHIARKNFAYVDSAGGEHLPIHDADHVRNAVARFNQTVFESVDAKEKARRKVLAAAKRHGIEVANGVRGGKKGGRSPKELATRDDVAR